MIREAIEIKLHLNNMNMEVGLCLRQSLKPFICSHKGRRNPPPMVVSVLTGLFRTRLASVSSFHPHPPACNLPPSSQWPTDRPKEGQFLSCSTIGSLPHLIIAPFPIGLTKFHLVWPIPVFPSNLLPVAYSSPWWWKEYTVLKCWFNSMRIQGALFQKAVNSVCKNFFVFWLPWVVYIN
jgi:hypothetical protein